MGIQEMNNKWVRARIGRDMPDSEREELVKVYNSILRDGLTCNEAHLLFLQTQYWQRLRRRTFARDGHQCVQCGSKIGLHCDHKRYVALGMERLEDLQTLCRVCHQKKSKYKLSDERKVLNVQEDLWRTVYG